MLHIRAHSLNLRTGLLLLLILAVRGQEGLPPAVTTWSKGTFAARISKHSSCYKALDPAADVSKLWPGAQRAVAEGILADYEEGSKYPFFRVFGNGSRFVRPEPSEITLRVINAGPGTTGTRSIHGMGCAAGYKQVHYDRICNLDGEQKAATDHLLRMHVKMRECSRHAADGGGVQKTPECLTATVLDEFREALIRAATSGVEVIADNPYNNFLPQWLEINPDLKVMMSLRNPEDWAVSRVKHRWDRLVRCRDGTKRSATYMNYLDCMQGTRIVAGGSMTLLACRRCRW